MLDILLLVQVLVSGLVCGLILFQSAFVAPTVFRDLPEENRPIILRSLFPKLFKSIAAAGFVLIIITLFRDQESMVPYFIGSFTLLSGFVCNAMIGATNQARDQGDDKLFSLLHRISVLLTVATLIANLIWIFLI